MIIKILFSVKCLNTILNISFNNKKLEEKKQQINSEVTIK